MIRALCQVGKPANVLTVAKAEYRKAAVWLSCGILRIDGEASPNENAGAKDAQEMLPFEEEEDADEAEDDAKKEPNGKLSLSRG